MQSRPNFDNAGTLLDLLYQMKKKGLKLQMCLGIDGIPLT